MASGKYALWAVLPARNASDWKGGLAYPGDVFVGSSTQFVSVKALRLTRANATAPVTGMTATSATLYNACSTPRRPSRPLSVALPDGGVDSAACWHCHTTTAGNVTAFKDGQFHQASSPTSATPGGTPAPLALPATHCASTAT